MGIRNKNVSEKEKVILDYIKNYIEVHNFTPTIRTIAKDLKYCSISTVAAHIRHLTLKGYLIGKGRTLRPTDKDEHPVERLSRSLIRQLKETPYVICDGAIVSLEKITSNTYNGTTYHVGIILKNEPHFEEVDDGIRC